MNRHSIKTMLFGISLILLGGSIPVLGTGYFYIANIALELFGFMAVLSGFFSKD